MQSLATTAKNVDTARVERSDSDSDSVASSAPKAAGKRPLGNHGNKVTPVGEVDGSAFSKAIWRLQRTMWGITSFKRLAGCHRWLADNSGSAKIHWTAPGQAHWGGLQQSDSVWASPLSALKISRVRADEVSKAVETWKAKSPYHAVEFLTLTVQHSRGQSLKDVWNQVAVGWKGIIKGASWRGGARYAGDKNRFGIRHYCRSTEVTLGSNGWHTHLHVLFFLQEGLALEERETLQERLFTRWKDAIVRAGYKAPNVKHGIKLEEAVKNQDAEAMGAYMAKGSVVSIGYEIASGQQKKARFKNSRTPFQLLADIATARENKENYQSDLRLWREWEETSLGKRQMTWSRGAKKELGVLDLNDSKALALAEEEEQAGAYSVATVLADDWKTPAPGAEVRLSDDIDTRRLIIEEVAKAKTPAHAQKRAERILTSLGIRFKSELVCLQVEPMEPAVNILQSREILRPSPPGQLERPATNIFQKRQLLMSGLKRLWQKLRPLFSFLIRSGFSR